ncbi:TIR domain protein [compost metagenome]
MTKRLERDYVWECDFGERSHLKPIIKKLLDEQDASSLQMVSLMVNHNVYGLEYFVVFSYDNPVIGQIELMKDLMAGAGVRYRPDITYNELISELAHKRFNLMTLIDSEQVDLMYDHNFEFKERREVAKDISMRPLGKKLPVFISHTSKNKPLVEEIIAYLNAANLPVWYDDINIDFGESIVNKVQEGIKDSGAVIFWITNDFLKSNWCQIEMESFLARLAGKNDVMILTIVFEDVHIEKLPLFIAGKKFLKVSSTDSINQIANKLIPTLQKYFNAK